MKPRVRIGTPPNPKQVNILNLNRQLKTESTQNSRDIRVTIESPGRGSSSEGNPKNGDDEHWHDLQIIVTSH